MRCSTAPQTPSIKFPTSLERMFITSRRHKFTDAERPMYEKAL